MDYEYLEEKSINAQTIMQLLKRAFIKCEIDEDGDIKFTIEGYRGFIEIDENRKIIRFMMIFGFVDNITEIDKLELVSRINSKVIFNQFYASNNSIYSNYYLLFEEGLPSYQLIASLRKFVSITTKTFAEEELIA